MLSVGFQAVPLRIRVQTPESAYSILLGQGLLDGLGELAAHADLGRRAVIASDSNVAFLYGERVEEALGRAGFSTTLVSMAAGEEHKTLHTVEQLVEDFLNAGLDRSGWVLALGGGVVGDTAGFAASVYMRGVPLVQAPTTLLAMADSSIGGKVGVDHPRGKNLLGAFKHPALVVADTSTLATLPAEHVANGMAEVIKAAIIGDARLFDLLEARPLQQLDITELLARSIEVKRRIVESDPYEKGERALLNLGHTFGHAFEQCSGYRRLHGLAVAQGISVAFHIAELTGRCNAGTSDRVAGVLAAHGLPVRWGGSDLSGGDSIERVMAAMRHDKKRWDGTLRLVLPEAIGRVSVESGVEESVIREALENLQ